MAKIGYARVSTEEQNLDGQITALEVDGCDRVYSEKKSGVRTEATRQSLDHALKALRPGDELVAVSLDRIGRSTAHLLTLIDDLKKRGVRVRTLNDGFDSSKMSAHEELTLAVKAAFAQFERSMNSERTKRGMAAAKKDGKHVGRPRKLTPATIRAIQKLRDKGETSPQIAHVLKIGLTSVKRALRLEMQG